MFLLVTGPFEDPWLVLTAPKVDMLEPALSMSGRPLAVRSGGGVIAVVGNHGCQAAQLQQQHIDMMLFTCLLADVINYTCRPSHVSRYERY